MTTAIIIDTDPGIDDVVTLALAARSPELEIVAVTTTYGNATLARTTRNARHVLALAGRSDIPVIPGADRPLVRPLVTAPETHGESGVGHAEPEGEGEGEGEAGPPSCSALPAVVDALHLADAPITLVTLGPLTNLAHALRTDPDLVATRVRRHIGMFGSLHERGNTNRWADFNAWCDPEAVAEVFGAELPTEMVGLDVTRRMTLDRAEVDRLGRSSDPLVRWLADALRFYVEFHCRQERLDGCVVNDVLTIGQLLEPHLLDFARFRLKIDTGDGEYRGRTLSDPAGATIRVALDVDVTAMRRLLDRPAFVRIFESSCTRA